VTAVIEEIRAAEGSTVSERLCGGAESEGPDGRLRSESRVGPPARHIDSATAQLDRLARSWIDVQQTRKALAQRELDDSIVDAFAKAEDKIARALTRTLRSHDLWPWLSQFPGLGGAHTALVIGRIGDPRRYPGQRCSEGHYLPPVYTVGDPCPIVGDRREIEHEVGDGAELAGTDERRSESDGLRVCPGVMLEPRTTSGVRSLWHWAGLHADEGRAPRKRKGQRCTWEPRVRASVMQPGGIAEQIVRLSVPHYVDIYREAKARLILRVPDQRLVSEGRCGGAILNGRTAATPCEVEESSGRPLRLFEADRIARKIAAKAFLGDLLTEWKRSVR
jgi:hypothetical protein